MADKRAFAKFDVGYLDNPKMMDVLDSSLHAICMHFASVLYCSQHLTDGIVAPKAMQRKTGGSDADVQILLESGLWHAPEHDCENCPQPPANKVYVHDFLEHNRDSAEAKRVSEKRSKAAKARWEGEANSNASRMQSALQNEDVCNAEREREKEIPKPKGLGGPRKRATRIPDGWTPSDELANAMLAECPTVNQQAEHRKFVDYWTGKSGKDATKVDWNATYRNWIRRAGENAPQQNLSSSDRRLQHGLGVVQRAAQRSAPQNPFEGRELTA